MTRPAQILTIAMATLALSACTSMLLGGGSSGERAAAAESRSSTQVASDNSISGAIRRRYSADADISRFAIGIRTTSGNVTLTGTVGSYPVRDKAVRIARDTDGVRRVDSRIVVNTNL